jgi:integrase
VCGPEPRRPRRGAATGGKVAVALADAIEGSLPPRDDRDLTAPLLPGVTSTTLRTAIARACRATGTPLLSPHDLKHRRISLLHAQGMDWAQIADLGGNRSAKVLADTSTRVLMDERELDYEALIAERLGDREALLA